MTTYEIDRDNLYLFHQGTNYYSYRIMGAHITVKNGANGVRFAVWAPNAAKVCVVGDFNGWDGSKHRMRKSRNSGVWSLFIEGMGQGDIYKYEIHTADGRMILKSDPYGFYSEVRPETASVVVGLDGYSWKDQDWIEKRSHCNVYESPINIYEVHAGSWRRKENDDLYTYREIADELSEYAVDMGYTHIELLPISEHPFDGSWGYQSTGYYSVTSRYGTPEDFMYFVDTCHQKGIGVIIDWVPGHFCKDSHGLYKFDGSSLYEYHIAVKGENYEWGTANFDLGRPEVKSFLISNAMFWIDCYHIDGIRVDAVASMLYLDYGKNGGEWLPNQYGGRENIEAVGFMRQLNETLFKHYSGILVVAEESSQWPMITAPTYLGGLGYNYKWNMGWMNDMLRYMEMDPIHRKWHHNLITFSFFYAFSENFILPLSHDEVVHGKKSLLDKMPGDYWRKFANLRLLYGYMIAHPGKKLLFMSGELGQFIEWRYYEGIEWKLLEYEKHKKMQDYVKALNKYYLNHSVLWQMDHSFKGFEWIDPNNHNQSIIVFMRKGKRRRNVLVVVCNFTPAFYENYNIGVPYKTRYDEVFNSDLESFGGSGQTNDESVTARKEKWHNQPYHIQIKVPPLAAVYFRPVFKYKLLKLKEKRIFRNKL